MSLAPIRSMKPIIQDQNRRLVTHFYTPYHTEYPLNAMEICKFKTTSHLSPIIQNYIDLKTFISLTCM